MGVGRGEGRKGAGGGTNAGGLVGAAGQVSPFPGACGNPVFRGREGRGGIVTAL